MPGCEQPFVRFFGRGPSSQYCREIDVIGG
jgi:hypothetical protein